MSGFVFLAVENVIPPDHPVAFLAIPIGLLFLSGSIILLLWSNYGIRKAGAIYGTAFFGFAFLLGIFWWFGAPGILPGLGISHLPGQPGDYYAEEWFAFEAGSERAEYFPAATELEGYEPVQEYAGFGDVSEEEAQTDPGFANLAGSAQQASDAMLAQFLPADENGVLQIGVERRQGFEEDAEAGEPSGAAARAQPFFAAEPVGDVLLKESPETGVLLATQEFQAFATYTDADGIPLEPVPVGEPMNWYAFFDPGAEWFPSALWTGLALLGFILSLLALDRLEARDQRLLAVEAEEPEDLEVPIAR